MGWSAAVPPIESPVPFGRPRFAELRGGFVRACRAGCDLRAVDESVAVVGLADFMAIVVGVVLEMSRVAVEEEG